MPSVENAENGVEHEDLPKESRTPLPLRQLFIVSLLQGAEPVSSTVIFPFINQSVRESGITGGDESKTGYYAGVIESIFYLAECMTVVHWGRLSDRIGRKPVMMIGLFGLMISMIVFGLSKQYWLMVVSRSIQGMSNGNMGMTKNIMAEITDETNIADAFAWIPLIWSAGSTIGPIIGGGLSNPAERWPAIFGQSEFFRHYPYFLPCAVAGGFAATCLVLSWFLLEETLPSIVARKKGKRTSNSSPDPTMDPLDSETTPLLPSPDNGPPPIRSVLIPNVVVTLINMAFLTFTDQSSQVLQPLMYSTPIDHGGLGFTPYTIGMTMGVWGFVNGIYQIVVFGKIVRRFGARRTYIFAYSCLLGTIGAYPIMSDLARRAGRADALVWTVLILQLCLCSQLYMAYGCIYTLLVGVTPSPAALATINGIGQMTGSTMRSIAPSFASSLFSLSMQHNIAGGRIVYYILWMLVLAGILASLRLPKRT